MTLRVDGTVRSTRTWARKDGTPVRSVELTFEGGNYEAQVHPSNDAFARLGVGERVVLSVVFTEHRRFGFQAVQGIEPTILKAGA